MLSRKSVSASRLHGVCMGRSGTRADAVDELFSHFCYVGSFGDVGEPVLPNVRGVSGDVVTVYAYYDTEGHFLQSIALLRAGHNLYKRREMTVSPKNGLVNGPAHNVLTHFSRLVNGPAHNVLTHLSR